MQTIQEIHGQKIFVFWNEVCIKDDFTKIRQNNASFWSFVIKFSIILLGVRNPLSSIQ